MRWAYPENFWWLGVVLAVVGFAVLMLYRQRRGLQHFGLADAALTTAISPRRQYLKAGVRVFALALIGIALLGPCWGEQEVPPTPAQGRDLIVVLDVSRSMGTEDVAPSRLGRAKQDLKTLARTLERRGGYRIGLIAFADRAALLCPLTTDFRHFYEEVDHATVENLRLHHDGIVSQDGTELAGGLARADRALPKLKADAEEKKSYCDILVVSDGGDEMDDQTTAIAAALAEKQVRVFTVGVGDPTKTAPIPVQGPTGRRSLLTFQGEIVQTKLEETLLREVARTTSAAYVAAGVQPLPVDQLVPLLETEPTRELNATGQIKDPIQRYEWFLLPAVLLLIGESVLSTRRRLPKTTGPALPSKPPWLVRLIPPPRRPITGVMSKKQEVVR